MFDINSNTGEIYTLKPLDHEEQKLYVLQVRAENERSSATTNGQNRNCACLDQSIVTVYIEVTNKNDYAPNFLSDVYTGC